MDGRPLGPVDLRGEPDLRRRHQRDAERSLLRPVLIVRQILDGGAGRERDRAAAGGRDVQRRAPRQADPQRVGRLDKRAEREREADAARRQVGVVRHHRRVDREQAVAEANRPADRELVADPERGAGGRLERDVLGRVERGVAGLREADLAAERVPDPGAERDR